MSRQRKNTNRSLQMDQVSTYDSMYVDLGSGSDSLEISRSSAAIAYLLGGNDKYGDDTLEATDNAFDTLHQEEWETYVGKSRRKIGRRF